MTKKDLVAHVSGHAGLTKKQAGMAVDAFLDGVMNAIAVSDGKVSLVGFGTFANKQRAARTGVDPKTHAKRKYPAKRVPHFKPGKTLKELVEKGPRKAKR